MNNSINIKVGGVWRQWKNEKENMIEQITNLNKELMNIKDDFNTQNNELNELNKIKNNLLNENENLKLVNKNIQNDYNEISIKLNNTLKILNVFNHK